MSQGLKLEADNSGIHLPAGINQCSPTNAKVKAFVGGDLAFVVG